MQIENSYGLNFGQIKRVPTKMELGIVKENVNKARNFLKLQNEQELNPVNLSFKFDKKNKLLANISYESDYFQCDNKFKKGIFETYNNFYKRMCKVADKTNQSRMDAMNQLSSRA